MWSLTLVRFGMIRTLLPVALALMLPATAIGQGEIYATNENDFPISVYPRTGNGEVPPLRVISGEGAVNANAIVADEVNNEIIVGNCNGIFVFDRQASGAASPRRTIQGSATDLGCFGRTALALDVPHNEIFVCSDNGILVFSRTANGNVAPLRRIAGPATGACGPSPGLAVDPGKGEVFLSDFLTIRVFPRTASGNAPPIRQFGVVAASSITLDVVNEEIFVGIGVGGVQVYSRTANGSASSLRAIFVGRSVRSVSLDPVHGELFVYHEGGINVYRRTDSDDAPHTPPATPLRTIPTGAATQLAGGLFTSIAVTTTNPPGPTLVSAFVPVTPCRIIDTRNPSGSFGGPFIAAGATRTIPVPSSLCGIPAGAAAYALNVTVVPRGGPLGYLTLWPTGQAQPFVSTLNSFDGSVLANAAIVPAGRGGGVDAFATNDTELIIDINGYFDPPSTGTLQFYPLSPCRVLDTRNATATFGGPPISANTFRSFPIPSSGCGALPTASAYSFNVTVVPHGGLGFLTAWPSGQMKPFVSTLNSFDGTVLANAAIVPAGTGGAVSFYASDTTDLVVDINGYFATPGPGGLNFHTVPPCRLVDTRTANGPLGGPILPGNASRSFPLPTGPCGLPASAPAYSLNITVVPAGPLAYLTTWPTGLPQPFVSALNDLKGLPVANAALVPAGTAGAVSVFVTNSSHVVIDTNGYFGP